MKPIFMVIVGSAMLIPAMHQITYKRTDSLPERKAVLQSPPVEVSKQHPDSEVSIHCISYWLERLP